MKYIKYFENTNGIKVGDYVKVYFVKNDIFKVKKVKKSENKYYLDQFGTDDYFRRYQIEKVLSQPTPEEVEEYYIRKNVKKYNL